jgi:hypothetical protein
VGSLSGRLKRLEATSKGVGHETPPELEIYFKLLEGTPLTPQERAWKEATDNSPMMQAYWKELEQQQEAQLLREERGY